ncbi:MAG TPA: hypothetical protein VHF89_02315 [Solirubrobacteraceae bacterium]|nr:hypothetical protein [Solirubrobacteraceae bacterium]
MKAFGGFRARVAFDLVRRRHHAFSLLRQASYAKTYKLANRLTVVELGVASGQGLLNLADVARKVTGETGVPIDVVGFDSGVGMPPPVDHRDHPEFYIHGDYPMDRGRLEARLPSNATLVIGDIASTVPEFTARLGPEAPLAFFSLDVDSYTSSKAALAILDGEAGGYLPQVLVYADDVMEFTHNRWAGELLAIRESNDERPLRKLDRSLGLRASRVFKRASWIDQMFMLHVLDHPRRQPGGGFARPPRVM